MFINFILNKIKFNYFNILFVIILLLIYLRYLKNKRLYDLARKIPGPFCVPVLGSMFHIPKDLLKFLMQYVIKYSGTFAIWIGPNPVIFVSNPKHLNILFNHPGVLTRGPYFVKISKIILRDGLIICRNKQKWYDNRKAIASTFTPTILDSFIDLINVESNCLVRNMEEQLNNEMPFDAWHYVSLSNLKIICKTIMGSEAVNETKIKQFLEASEQLFEVGMHRLVYIWELFDFIYKFTKNYQIQRKCINIMDDFVNQLIIEKHNLFNNNKIEIGDDNECSVKNKNQRPFLDYLLELLFTDDNKWNLEKINDEINFFLLAGYETSSSIICFALVELAFNPEIQRKAYEELQEIFDGNKNDLTSDDLKKMNYLEMIIKETLRKYPIVPVIPRFSDQDIDLGDFIIPKGVNVYLNVYGAQNNPNYWFNPNVFDPDRFHPENIQNQTLSCFKPFGGGLRLCLGSKYAMISMKIMLSNIIRNYKITTKMKQHEFELKINITLKTTTGFLINLEKRN